MQKIVLISLLLCSTLGFSKAPFWGKTGHRATAEIATKYLSKKAEKKINDLLDGEGIALVSTFADEIKSDSVYAEYSAWHYINLPKGKTYDQVKADLKEPHIIAAIQKVKKGLKDKTTSREEKQFYLKMLIHLIGDLHQPLHIGRPEDLGGNKIRLFWFNQPTNLHQLWDDNLLDHFQMSYSELAANERKLSEEERALIQSGNAEDWLRETAVVTEKIYDSVKENDRLGYDYAYHWTPTLRDQIQKGGIRLAKVLNDIFD